MSITADEVIEALERALRATWADLDGCEKATSDAQELLELYRNKDKPKYHLFQKEVTIFGVHGFESVVADDDGHITSHIRQLDRALPAEDGWWASYKDCIVDQLDDGWVSVGDPKTLEEVIEWAEGL